MQLENATIGDYRIVSYIGEGGMGQVYRAIHNRIGRTVAIKVLGQSAAESVLVQRFINEARIQASLRHPGIAALYDFTEYRGRPVIIMEYVDGQTIQDITRARGPWSAADAVPILVSCATTLEYVHSQGIVHRDLKSANLKITSTGDLKLLDFGIATAQMASRLTKTGFVVGSFQSLAPEQARGEPATPASDIWAFGVLAYEMMTATLPFEGSTQMELFSKILKGVFVPPTVLKPNVPMELERVITHCLRRKPEDRYPSMAALRQDLERVPLNTSRSTGRHIQIAGVRSSKKMVAIAGGVAAAIVIGAGVYVYQANTTVTPPSPPSPQPVPPDPNPANMTQVLIDVNQGHAEVWQGNQMLGHTPYTISGPYGQHVSLVLREEGYQDKQVDFDIGGQPALTLQMQRTNEPE
jgi:eukaryotic-like serine/threonine-protein kinase